MAGWTGRIGALALVGTCLLAGCAADRLDPTKVAEAIAEEVPDAGLVEVRCPPEIEARAGATFECVATGPGGVLVLVEVTQRDAEGNVSFVFGRNLVRTDTVAGMLEADVSATLDAEVTLSCPAVVVLADETGSFECSGRDEGGASFTITVAVDDGTVVPDGWEFVR